MILIPVENWQDSHHGSHRLWLTFGPNPMIEKAHFFRDNLALGLFKLDPRVIDRPPPFPHLTTTKMFTKVSYYALLPLCVVTSQPRQGVGKSLVMQNLRQSSVIFLFFFNRSYTTSQVIRNFKSHTLLHKSYATLQVIRYFTIRWHCSFIDIPAAPAHQSPMVWHLPGTQHWPLDIHPLYLDPPPWTSYPPQCPAQIGRHRNTGSHKSPAWFHNQKTWRRKNCRLDFVSCCFHYSTNEKQVLQSILACRTHAKLPCSCF